MKKIFFTALISILPLLSFSQESNDEKDPETFNNYALYYAADFDAMKYGNFGVDCETFGIYKGIGVALSLGWTTKMTACLFKLGPSYCIPFNDKMALSINLRYAAAYDKKLISAFNSDPHLIFKAGKKLRLNLGFDVIAVKDNTSFGPYFGIGINFD